MLGINVEAIAYRLAMEDMEVNSDTVLRKNSTAFSTTDEIMGSNSPNVE